MADAPKKSKQPTFETLTKDQLKILRGAFDAFDKDKKGSIPTDTVGTILEMLGQKLSEEELEDVIDEFDSNESGEFEFEEFATLAARFVEPEEDYDALRKELREAFMLYDREGTGFITLEIFKDILRQLDGAIPEEELDEILDEIDADGSGTVDFEEFMGVMTGE